MSDERLSVLWPSRENYARFRAVCDDEVAPTFDEFEMLASRGLMEIEKAEGIVIDKIGFDPDRMALWCRTHFGQVDTNARSYYAAFISLSD